MWFKNESNEALHSAHTAIPRPPYLAHARCPGFSQRSIMLAHAWYSGMDERLCLVTTSRQKQPQETVSFDRNAVRWTVLILPQSQTQLNLRSLPILAASLNTTRRPNRVFGNMTRAFIRPPESGGRRSAHSFSPRQRKRAPGQEWGSWRAPTSISAGLVRPSRWRRRTVRSASCGAERLRFWLSYGVRPSTGQWSES